MSTIKVDTVRPVTADASLTLQGDNSGTGISGITIDSSGNATFAQTIAGGTIGSSVVFPAGHTIKRLSKVTNSNFYNFYSANPGSFPNNTQIETASGTPAVIQVNTADLLYPGSSKLEITFNMNIYVADYSFGSTTERREQINIGVNSSTITYSSIPEYWVQSSNFYSPFITHRGVIDITSPSTNTSYYYFLYSLNPTAGNSSGTLLSIAHSYSEYRIVEVAP